MLDVGEYGIWHNERSAASIASLEKHPNVKSSRFRVTGLERQSDDVVVVDYKADLTSVSVSNGQQHVDSWRTKSPYYSLTRIVRPVFDSDSVFGRSAGSD